jgi:hypothetical protein
MIIATFIVACGLTVGAWAATTRGYRLSGVVVVSLLAIYTLVDVSALPVFVLSTLLAYVGILVVQERWLVYGRRLLLTAIVLGAVVPVAIYLVADVAFHHPAQFTEFEFLGSILPGIAAYNYHREDAERRLPELLASVGLFVGLSVVGVGSLVLWTTPPCTTCQLFGHSAARYVSPILLTGTSDVARLLGLQTVPGATSVGSVETVTVVVLLGLVVAELTRSRWGLRPTGVIALPLVVLFSLRVWWTVPLYVTVIVASYLIIQVVHAWTLLYGRALLSIASVFGVLVAATVLVVAGLTDGMAVFFAGLLGGIGAYNLHVIAPRERVTNAVVNFGIFVGLFGVARALIVPLPTGLATTVSWSHLLVGAVALGATAWVLVVLERPRPSAQELQTWTLGPEEVER